MQEKISRRQILKAGLGLAGLLIGCRNEQTPIIVKPFKKQASAYKIPSTVSYKLEDLCDTEIKWRDITLNVYIEEYSEFLWDYHKYREEIFDYVRDFFEKQKIDCKIKYSKSKFNKFEKSNEFGVEIWDEKKDMEDRYLQLTTKLEDVENNPLKFIGKGYAVTRAQVGLVDGADPEFKKMFKKGELTIEEIEAQYPEKYKGTTRKEYLFKDYAGTISHELLHLMGLFHPRTFKPFLIDTHYNNNPNVMSFYPLRNSEKPGEYCLNPLQQKLIHSFIAGNNTYKAFFNSQRDLDFFIENIAKANNLEVR